MLMQTIKEKRSVQSAGVSARSPSWPRRHPNPPEDVPASIGGDNAMHRKLSDAIVCFFRDVARVALTRPGWWVPAIRLLLAQRKSAQKRDRWREQGVQVPPFLILSVTSRCNLRCAGCYAKALHNPTKKTELSSERLVELLSEAHGMGISSVLVAGGEPLTRPDIFEVTRRFPTTAFALFTNGTLLNGDALRSLGEQRNVVAVVSIEGNRLETDERRGEGVFSYVESTMERLRKSNIFFGCSITVTRNNFGLTLSDEWVRRFHRNGCKLFIFVEYVPVEQSAGDLTISKEQRLALLATMAAFRKKFRALFVAFPGDEEEFGGCLAAGRGFIHINPSGNLEPCPFAPYSDRNVAESSLKRALRSPLLEQIRANHDRLEETVGGCALWNERAWVASLVKEQEGGRT